MDVFVAAIGFALVGTLVGSVTGLVPGIHVNTIAAWAIATHMSFSSWASGFLGISGPDSLVVLSAFLASTMISHEFTEIIPSVFIGAPEPDSSLTVYPGHRLLRKGLGYQAIVASASGTLVGALAALVLIIPLRIVMGPPLNGYVLAEPAIPYILIIIVILIVMLERRTNFNEGWYARATALGVFLISGVFGQLILNAGGLPIPPEQVLFPMFTGLFGISTLLFSLKGKEGRIPNQKTVPVGQAMDSMRFEKNRTSKTFISSLSGALVSFFPGVSGAQATSVANVLTGGDASEPRSYIYHISAIKISASIFSLMALFTILKGRSGVAVAISNMFPSLETWSSIADPPEMMLLILVAMVLALALSFFILLSVGNVVARNAHKLKPKPLSTVVIVFLIVLVGLFTGPFGLAVLAVATCIGLLAPVLGVSRVHLMGVLIVPVIMYYFAM
jgi:putative membrane protein